MVQYINISPFFSSAMLSLTGLAINPNLDLFTHFIWLLGSESYCSKNFNLDCCYLGNWRTAHVYWLLANCWQIANLLLANCQSIVTWLSADRDPHCYLPMNVPLTGTPFLIAPITGFHSNFWKLVSVVNFFLNNFWFVRNLMFYIDMVQFL